VRFRPQRVQHQLHHTSRVVAASAFRLSVGRKAQCEDLAALIQVILNLETSTTMPQHQTSCRARSQEIDTRTVCRSESIRTRSVSLPTHPGADTTPASDGACSAFAMALTVLKTLRGGMPKIFERNGSRRALQARKVWFSLSRNN